MQIKPSAIAPVGCYYPWFDKIENAPLNPLWVVGHARESVSDVTHCICRISRKIAGAAEAEREELIFLSPDGLGRWTATRRNLEGFFDKVFFVYHIAERS